MGLKITYNDGETPLDEDEKNGLLIKTISARSELDEFEQANIQKAVEWTLKKKFSDDTIFTEEFVLEVHKRMFNDVWKWAGKYRRSNKNIGIDKYQIPIALRQLNEDAVFWCENKVFNPEEIAIRYSHQIVKIHLFPNGNGRHSRLMADIIISHIYGKPFFSWGRSDLSQNGEARKRYLKAVYMADEGSFSDLIKFARS